MTRQTGLAQQPLNRFAGDDAARADAELNRVYGLLTSTLAKKPTALAALKKSQLAWLAFRDAAVKAEGEPWTDGSARPFIEASMTGSLTRERTAWLLLALAGKAALATQTDRAEADKLLNTLWGKREGLELAAQRAWLAWRDAEVAFWSVHGGTGTRETVLARLTWERCRPFATD